MLPIVKVEDSQNGHRDALNQCPLLGIKRTSRGHAPMSAIPPKADTGGYGHVQAGNVLTALKDDAMGLFEKGREKTGGRTSGTRNKFSKKFDEALLKDFEEHGEGAIKIARIERPTEYLKLIASRFPIEFQFTDSRLKELSDDELDAFITHMRSQLGSVAADVDRGEDKTLN